MRWSDPERANIELVSAHNFLLLPFALAVATWLAWPIYGAAVNTGKIAP